MKTKFIELMRYCRTPFELNAKPGDQVLIVTDTEQDQLVWQGLAAAAREMDCEVTVAMMTPRPHHQADATPPVVEAMKKADLSIYATTKAMAASKTAIEARKVSSAIFMEEVNAEILTSGGATLSPDEYKRMHEFGRKVLKVWEEGQEGRVTSELGTDLKFRIRDRKTGKVTAHLVSGIIASRPGFCAFPDGEVPLEPEVGYGEGTVVWDTTMHYPPGLMNEPVKLTVKEGRVTDIQGGIRATQFRKYVEAYGDEKSWECPGEVSIGINPKAEPVGILRADKKLLGAVHVAMGFYGRAKLHIDGIMRYPTVSVDGKTIVEKGVIKIGNGRF